MILSFRLEGSEGWGGGLPLFVETFKVFLIGFHQFKPPGDTSQILWQIVGPYIYLKSIFFGSSSVYITFPYVVFAMIVTKLTYSPTSNGSRV